MMMIVMTDLSFRGLMATHYPGTELTLAYSVKGQPDPS